MVDTETLRSLARVMREGGNVISANNIDDAANEIDAGRIASLDRCRDRSARIVSAKIATGQMALAAMNNESIVAHIEAIAHAMLAAEHPPKT